MSKLNKVSHTPGPWKATHFIDYEETRNFEVEGPKGVVCVTYEHDLLESEANAHLIAAAPEMLEALKRITSFQYNKDGTLMTDAEANAEQVKIARAAIAKAEGRTK